MNRLLFTALLLFLTSGCAAHKKAAPDPRPIVTRVDFEGNEAFRDAGIRPALEQESSQWWRFIPPLNLLVPPHRLDTDSVEDDRIRIANWYALRGYFDARAQSTDIRYSKQLNRFGQARFARVHHVLSEGEPSLVRNVELLLSSSIEEDKALLLALQLRKLLTPAKATIFNMEAAEAQRKILLAHLRANTFVRSQVELSVKAYPEDKIVDLSYLVDVDAPAIFGELRINGLDKVREAYVRRLISFKPGQPWDDRKLTATQRDIYDMGMFSMVTLSPDINSEPLYDAKGRQVVPVNLMVRERKARNLELGGGLGWEAGRIDLHAAAHVTHNNILRQRIRGTGDLELGFAFINSDSLGLTGKLELGLQAPDFPLRGLTPSVKAGISLDVEDGYNLWSPSGEAGLTWAPLTALRLQVFYRAEYTDTFSSSELENSSVDDSYLLSMIRESILLDLRDQPMAASKGILARFSAVHAFGIGKQSGPRFDKLDGEFRAYIPMGTKRVVLATRTWAGAILTPNEADSIPIPERLFVGGDGSVRGWRRNYIGPRDFEKNCERRDCVVPLGGNFGMSASVELRVNVWREMWVAGFAEAGRVWGDLAEVPWQNAAFLAKLQPSVGGGLRYDSPVGRIRLDIAVHPKAWTDEAFQYRTPDQTGGFWNLHIGLGESF